MPRGFSAALLLAVACGSSAAPSPFWVSQDAGVEASVPDAAAGAAGVAGAGPDAGDLGAVCDTDSQCGDDLDCTLDWCDPTLGRCRSDPDGARCADGEYCNGVELCDPRLGCVAGDPVTCSDEIACTIDRCDETTRSCRHLARDADGDSDPDLACTEGGDCDDTNPYVSSLAAEICENGQDDDCDSSIDEAACVTPDHDTCADPLEVSAAGSYEIALAAAGSDYAASCAGGGSVPVDVVAAIQVTDGPRDVDLVVTVTSGSLVLAAFAQCGDASSELSCQEGVEPPFGGRLARLRLHSLSDGYYPIVVFAAGSGTATLVVDYLPPSEPPANETCGTAIPIEAGVNTLVPVADVLADHESLCGAATGELVYEIELDSAADVRLVATSMDGQGDPAISLRDAACTEIACRKASVVDLLTRALPAGIYAVAVAASAPTDVSLAVEVGPPSAAPDDDTCVDPPAIIPGIGLDVPLLGHADDVRDGCLVGAADAVYALDLDQSSDVRVVQRISDGDTGGVAIFRPACLASEVVSCSVTDRSPGRAGARALPAGSYRVVSETVQGNPTQLLALVRPASSPVLVAFADRCSDAVTIPEAGGLLQGNTANASHDYPAGCDAGGTDEAPAPDQMLSLTLAAPRRVILDLQGSSYQTLLAVRRGPDCPGTEVLRGCAAGYLPDRSYLDLTLEAGQYYVEVSGYAGDAGAWLLDVHVVDP
jgi:hypothetical protein